MKNSHFQNSIYTETVKNSIEYYDNNTVKYNKLYKKMYAGSLIIENDDFFINYISKKKEKK